ncbi:MAG: CPBP family intramembrane metalloprotease [Crenarchaeota archaeon]|nr:CPBP family intramembrane metalloprotease [Thermoproteota archaeon]
MDSGFKHWRVLASVVNLFVFWLLILQTAGVTPYLEQRVLELTIIILLSSVVPLLLMGSQIRASTGLQGSMSGEQLTFLATAFFVMPTVFLLESFTPACGIFILPLLEEWFFRGLLLSILVKIDASLAISVSSLVFALTHFFHYGLGGFLWPLLFGVVAAVCQVRYKNIFLPMSLHVFWNWWNNYGDNLLAGSGLTYFGGLALGISYVLSSLVAKIMEQMQPKKRVFW